MTIQPMFTPAGIPVRTSSPVHTRPRTEHILRQVSSANVSRKGASTRRRNTKLRTHKWLVSLLPTGHGCPPSLEGEQQFVTCDKQVRSTLAGMTNIMRWLTRKPAGIRTRVRPAHPTRRTRVVRPARDAARQTDAQSSAWRGAASPCPPRHAGRRSFYDACVFFERTDMIPRNVNRGARFSGGNLSQPSY